MERLKVDTSFVEPLGGQYTEFDKANYYKLINSLKRFGQIRPINVIIDEGNNLYCFEGRQILFAMKSSDIDLRLVEVNLWDLNSDDMVNLQLIINDLKFETNDIKLAEVLNKLKTPDTGKLPFTKETFEDYLKLINFDWEEYSRQEASSQTDLFN